jgi:hypothetical protein
MPITATTATDTSAPTTISLLLAVMIFALVVPTAITTVNSATITFIQTSGTTMRTAAIRAVMRTAVSADTIPTIITNLAIVKSVGAGNGVAWVLNLR